MTPCYRTAESGKRIRVLTSDEVISIRRDWYQGSTFPEIIERYQLRDRTRLLNLITYRDWPDLGREYKTEMSKCVRCKRYCRLPAEIKPGSLICELCEYERRVRHEIIR